ncbi:MAG: DUF2007 domain-containing protein [Ignavibacteria bacterium]|nr:DUF2007 domain-containing protein [Ignavibacteria bacterium]MDH7526652.1 DUF2007 domain-containing protein [Ignavibacteria bacterium]NPV11489.1 DUF2007 domain-containing protein [Ignavibacteria bacterium]
MKICPNCASEYEDSVNICSDCNVELVSKEEYEKLESKYSDWEEVFSSPQHYEAEMVKTNLESAGIEAMIFDQKDSSFPLGGELGEIKVFVPKDKVEDARLIIEKLESQTEGEEESE